MKAILANPKRVSEINKIHSEIKELFKWLTLEDVLIVGFNWNRDKIDTVMNNEFDHKDLDGPFAYKELKAFFYTWDWDGNEQLSKFKCYNQPAICRHARYRAIFLQDMESKGYNLSKKLSIAQLEEISCYSIGYATVSYAIKCYLIANYDNEQIKEYRGIQAQTGPVNNSMEHLFGCCMSNYEHTIICNDLVIETGLSSTDINTAFYTMG